MDGRLVDGDVHGGLSVGDEKKPSRGGLWEKKTAARQGVLGEEKRGGEKTPWRG